MLSERNLRLQKHEAVLGPESVSRVGAWVEGCKSGDEEGEAVKFEHPAAFVNVGFIHASEAARVQVRQSSKNLAYPFAEHLAGRYD